MIFENYYYYKFVILIFVYKKKEKINNVVLLKADLICMFSKIKTIYLNNCLINALFFERSILVLFLFLFCHLSFINFNFYLKNYN